MDLQDHHLVRILSEKISSSEGLRLLTPGWEQSPTLNGAGAHVPKLAGDLQECSDTQQP